MGEIRQLACRLPAKTSEARSVHTQLSVDAESVMLQRSWHLPPASKGHPQSTEALYRSVGELGLEVWSPAPQAGSLC